MLKNDVIGHLTVRIPIHLIEDQESWEIPQKYTYVAAGDAELVSHDIPAALHERFRETLEESGGLPVGTWGEAEMAATTTLAETPLPAAAPRPDNAFDFDFEKAL
jgi:hypothetical protein